jgi:hypothetical protein
MQGTSHEWYVYISFFFFHYLCLIGQVYMFYVGHVDKSSLYETLFHCNMLSKHHYLHIFAILIYHLILRMIYHIMNIQVLTSLYTHWCHIHMDISMNTYVYIHVYKLHHQNFRIYVEICYWIIYVYESWIIWSHTCSNIYIYVYRSRRV